MHAGKHQEYEKKLHDALLNKTQTAPNPAAENQKPPKNRESARDRENSASKDRENSLAKDRENSIAKDRENSIAKDRENSVTPPNRDSWPLLNRETEGKERKAEANSKKSAKSKSKNSNSNVSNSYKQCGLSAADQERIKAQNRNCAEGNNSYKAQNSDFTEAKCSNLNKDKTQITQNENKSKEETAKERNGGEIQNENNVKIHSFLDDNSSFFSQNTFQKIFSESLETETNTNGAHNGDFSINSNSSNVMHEPILDIHNTEDWEAAFGFTKHSNHLEELAKMRNNTNNGEIAHAHGMNGEVSQGVLDAFAAQKVNGVGGGFQKLFEEERANCFLKYQPGWLQNYELQQQKRQLEEQLAQLSLKGGYFGGVNRLG